MIAFVNVILGIWVAIAPFVLGYAGNKAVLWNCVLTGAVIALLTLISGRSRRFIKGLTVLLSAWVFVSTFVLGVSVSALAWNNINVAFVMITFAIFNGAMEPELA